MTPHNETRVVLGTQSYVISKAVKPFSSRRAARLDILAIAGCRCYHFIRASQSPGIPLGASIAGTLLECMS